MARYNRIFAALDGGSTQEAVVRRALSIAHDNNAEVLFGHIIDSVPYDARRPRGRNHFTVLLSGLVRNDKPVC